MAEESHRNAMNDAIRAQRERGNVPKSMLPPEDAPAPVAAAPEPVMPEPEPVVTKSFFSRLLGR